MRDIGRARPSHWPTRDRLNTPVIIYVTVCTKDRKKILASPAVHDHLVSVWQTKPTWLVGKYMIMPDHIHFFCAPEHVPTPPLKAWMKFWKSYSASRWPEKDHQPVWQRDFWDTQLRRGDGYTEKWEYVVQNPVRAGLVSRSEDWPYQGALETLYWMSM